MYGPYEDLRTRIVWYRDSTKRNLTPEQEKFLSEEGWVEGFLIRLTNVIHCFASLWHRGP